MGRHPNRSPDQLRELILRSAHDVIAEKGLAGASAREIASRIGYSPGTLYNLFDNLDDLLLQVEAQLLETLDERLAELRSPDDQVTQIARAFVDFSRDNFRLWNLIAQHDVGRGSDVPDWYSEKIERLVDRIECALAHDVVSGERGAQSLKHSARVLWAGLQGLTSISTAEKLSSVTGSKVDLLVDDLVDTYLIGLREKLRNNQL